MHTRDKTASHLEAARFLTTRWSVVLAARDGAPPESAEALEQLCRAYWFPLYAFVRREGYGPSDAEDLTQGFFERLLGKKYLIQVAQEKGRFRSFLLAAVRHFLADERDRFRALKRGGQARVVPIDTMQGETIYAGELTDGETPEKLFERRWALAVLERARERLRVECATAGRGLLYAALGEGEADRDRASYAEIAQGFGMTENAVKLAAFRLRHRYQEFIREEIAETVSSPREVDDEIQHLLRVLTEG